MVPYVAIGSDIVIENVDFYGSVDDTALLYVDGHKMPQKSSLCGMLRYCLSLYAVQLCPVTTVGST